MCRTLLPRNNNQEDVLLTAIRFSNVFLLRQNLKLGRMGITSTFARECDLGLAASNDRIMMLPLYSS